MTDTSEIFEAMKEHKKEIRHTLEPMRFKYAKQNLLSAPCSFVEEGDCIHIAVTGGNIDYWPYTGWFCGRKPLGKVKGRGIKNLISEINRLKL